MKQISQEQVTAILQIMYETNISAQQFDAVKKMLVGLPEIKKEDGTNKPENKNVGKSSK